MTLLILITTFDVLFALKLDAFITIFLVKCVCGLKEESV